jgi:hypothetical protein
MTDENHVGDRDDMVVGDNDHGDAVPQCGSCGVAWVDHMGIARTCAENLKLREERDALLKQRFEVDEREENLRYKIDSAWQSERDEARRQVCEFEMVTIKCAHDCANRYGWDCYEIKEKTP